MSPLLHVALLEPKIPQNTGNIGRLTLAMGLRLHLVGALGFDTDARALRRAGLDYWKHVDWARHASLDELWDALPDGSRTYCFSTRAERSYSECSYREGDCFLFGDEVTGLPQGVLERTDVTPVRIPLRSSLVRSLNLANATAIAVSEALRQLGHPAPAPPRPALPVEPCTQS